MDFERVGLDRLERNEDGKDYVQNQRKKNIQWGIVRYRERWNWNEIRRVG